MQLPFLFFCRLVVLLFIFFLTISIHAQSVLDTLYLFPDTTTIINNSIMVIEDISNAAIRIEPHYNWDKYVLDKILAQFISSIYQNQTKIFFRISTGEIPEDSILYDNLFNEFIPKVFYPEWQEIKVEPEISLKNLKNIYISGAIPFYATRSNYYTNKIIPNYFLYRQSRNEWIEGSPCHLAIKIIIKKALTSVKNKELPYHFELKQNYPNPFNSATKINFILEESGFTQLKIYDILGKEQIQLIKGYKKEGEYSIDFKPGNINSGCYFYTLIVNAKSISKKMIYLK